MSTTSPPNTRGRPGTAETRADTVRAVRLPAQQTRLVRTASVADPVRVRCRVRGGSLTIMALARRTAEHVVATTAQTSVAAQPSLR